MQQPTTPEFRLNYEEAFRFIVRDPRWLSKIALGAVFSFLSVFIIGAILVQGYLLLMAERVARAEPLPLPEWEDFGEIIRQGVSSFLLGLLLALPIILLYLLIFPLYLGAIGLLTGGSQAQVMGIGLMTLAGLAGLLIIPIAIMIAIIGPAAHAQLILHNGDLAAGLRFQEALRFIGRHKGQYAAAIALSFAVMSIFVWVGYIACFIGAFVTQFVAQLFQYHLIGQLCWYERTVRNTQSQMTR